MPIFEYQCEKCGKKNEKLELRKGLPSPFCFECNVEMQKTVSAGSFVINGFAYKNNYSGGVQNGKTPR